MKVSITSNKLFNLSNSESNLSHLVNTFDALNEIREQSLTTSREIVRDCSKSIRYMHRNDAKGSEGFGFIPQDGKWIKMPQKGAVIIKSFVEIGTNCCIDRPSVGNTFIDEGTKMDNLVQIGHGVKIGKNCAFAAQVGIAGGAVIGNSVILAGQVGVNNRVKVGNNVIASSKCGIHCDIEDGEVVSGFPAMKNKSWLRSSSVFKKLPELAKKLRQLDKK